MATVKEILNELKWRPEPDLDDAKIWYIHRGAPNDRKVISGSEIRDLGSSFMKTVSATIPYHRIVKVTHKEKVVFKR